jgi:UDP-N-acetylglucosamine 2-epimerase (non-hydrolysing)
VAHALTARGLIPSLIVTGQHPGLDLADHGLDAYQAVNLACAGEEDPHAHVARVSTALGPMLAGGPPDLLVVQGDTSSALGGARAAASADVPLAHVEAGLRTRDPALPWPEEEYRTEIDAKADLLFAPTDLSAFNLACERVSGRVHVTGNTGIDALKAAIATLPSPSVRDRAMPRILVTCHRRESWGEGIRSIASAVRELGSSGAASLDMIVPPNRHVAGVLGDLLDGCRNVNLLDPCSHRELLCRMREADLILSDSGGMQEEAPALGVPLLVLREKTERPEGIATGNMRLVGTCTETIVAETRRLLSDPAAYAAMSRPAFPYGDGRAAERIAAIIEAWLLAKLSPTMNGPPRQSYGW